MLVSRCSYKKLLTCSSAARETEDLRRQVADLAFRVESTEVRIETGSQRSRSFRAPSVPYEPYPNRQPPVPRQGAPPYGPNARSSSGFPGRMPPENSRAGDNYEVYEPAVNGGSEGYNGNRNQGYRPRIGFDAQRSHSGTRIPSRSGTDRSTFGTNHSHR